MKKLNIGGILSILLLVSLSCVYGTTFALTNTHGIKRDSASTIPTLGESSPYSYGKQNIGEKSIPATELHTLSLWANPDEEAKEELEVAARLVGDVSHTKDWEKNRQDFNDYCNDVGKTQWVRHEDTFWSGEKFILTAEVEGEKLPKEISVHIEGTNFSTRLRKRGQIYQGDFFNKDMFHHWGQTDSEKITFVFSGDIDQQHVEDIQQITVNDVEKYWLMHRKE